MIKVYKDSFWITFKQNSELTFDDDQEKRDMKTILEISTKQDSVRVTFFLAKKYNYACKSKQ